MDGWMVLQSDYTVSSISINRDRWERELDKNSVCARWPITLVLVRWMFYLCSTHSRKSEIILIFSVRLAKMIFNCWDEKNNKYIEVTNKENLLEIRLKAIPCQMHSFKGFSNWMFLCLWFVNSIQSKSLIENFIIQSIPKCVLQNIRRFKMEEE